jgi:prepilin-type processing-associated H-X9-DG protein
VLIDRLQALGNWSVSANQGTLRWYTQSDGKQVPTAVHRLTGGVPAGGNFLFEDGHVAWRSFSPDNPRGTVDLGASIGNWQFKNIQSGINPFNTPFNSSGNTETCV